MESILLLVLPIGVILATLTRWLEQAEARVRYRRPRFGYTNAVWQTKIRSPQPNGINSARPPSWPD
jgi:hypothetical protein